jgi:ATP-binding cassette, subfamily B, bacterial
MGDSLPGMHRVSAVLTGRLRARTIPLIVIAATAVFGAAIGLVPPLATKFIVDNGLLRHDYTVVLTWSAVVVGMSLIGASAGMLQSYLVSSVSTEIAAVLRSAVVERLLESRIGFFLDERNGTLINRAIGDVDLFEATISSTAVNVTSQLLAVAATLVTLIWFNWRLAMIAAVAMALLLVPVKLMNARQYDVSRRERTARDDLTSRIAETLSVGNVLLAKTFGRERRELELLGRAAADVRAAEIRSALAYRALTVCVNMTMTLGPVAVWLVGSLYVINGAVSVGTLVAFVALLTRLYQPMASMTSVLGTLGGMRAVLDRISQYLALPSEHETSGETLPHGPSCGAIELRSVFMAYPGSEVPALRGASFTVEPGTLTAVVGPSGSGKSTVVALLLRLLSCEAGDILIDGISVQRYSPRSLRDAIAVVPQDQFILHDTIYENVMCGDGHASIRDFERAIDLAMLTDFVRTLPHGRNTVVGEHGYKLSAGQRQRLALARTFLKNPKIVVLDEATSNLDSVTERAILASVNEVFHDRTRIIVAHRLSSITAADKIVVLQSGVVQQTGTHNELISQKGVYMDMFERQYAPAEAVSAS